MITKKMDFFGRELSIEIGRLAKQAHGAALVSSGDTQVLVTVVAKDEAQAGMDFFPLSVDYIEKKYSIGRTPGGYIKREGRPSQKEILSARLIDRPIRPLFPKFFKNETQVLVTVLSHDGEYDADILGTLGASIAFSTSNIPFQEPVASVRVAKVDGELIINPTFKQVEEAEIELIVAATRENIAMIEGEARECSEVDMLEAINFGHQAIKQLIDFQEEIIKAFGTVTKRTVLEPVYPEGLRDLIVSLGSDKIIAANKIIVKETRRAAIKETITFVKENVNAQEAFVGFDKYIVEVLHDVEYDNMRARILDEGTRLDGRKTADLRQLTSEINILKRTHGSALFTRGQTQVLGITTLGTKSDEQTTDNLEGEKSQSYYLQYNFPPYSTGEVKRIFGLARREVGHGFLAERSLKPILPSEQSFPYTIRIVAEVLESNGSSSMASVCAASLSLMHAGVPIKCPVAGIAMGLIKDGNKVAILTDILGDEDHLGDMDFKVAGTRQGITAFQMDMKIGGISEAIMEKAMHQAKDARSKILDNMEACIAKPNTDLSEFAPRITTIKINQAKIGMVIGPGGKQIREIIEKTGVTIDIDDTGLVKIASVNADAVAKAKAIIEGLVQEAEIGKTYKAKVKTVVEFGAFMEIFPGKEGLLHISEYDWKKIDKISDYVKLGDIFDVVCKGVDNGGKISLSRKALIERPPREEVKKETPA